MGNHLYYGDNLSVLRESFASDSVDLIYLDPPFNSQANYNWLFRNPTGDQSRAQIEAFEDTWHWNDAAEFAFYDVMRSGNSAAAEIIRAMRSFLNESDMMAYLVMMAVRLMELHRVLKPAGTLYLHCDAKASHYLKLMLDQIFGIDRFQAEIIWQRTATHNDAKRWPWLSDTILQYTKSNKFAWTPVCREQAEEDVKKRYTYTEPNGRRYRLGPMDAPAGGGMSAINKTTGKPNGWYVWKDYQPRLRVGATARLLCSVFTMKGGFITLKTRPNGWQGNSISMNPRAHWSEMCRPTSRRFKPYPPNVSDTLRRSH